MEALHALIQKDAVETVTNQKSLAFFNRIFFFSKTQPQMEANSIFEFTEQISEIRDFQNGDTKEHKDFLLES